MFSPKSFIIFGCALVGYAVVSTIPVGAQSKCTPLKVVGSGLDVANKAISSPGTTITRNNWNTDFVVPDGRIFRRYVATVKTDKNGQYDLKLALKYSDGTSKTYFEQPGRPMGINDTFTMTAEPESKKPYQVNVLMGGTTVVGKAVTIQVSGCSK